MPQCLLSAVVEVSDEMSALEPYVGQIQKRCLSVFTLIALCFSFLFFLIFLIFSVNFFQEIMMDHSLRTISYIADIGDIVVIMARRRTMVTQSDIEMRRKRQSKILCHVFESEEVSF